MRTNRTTWAKFAFLSLTPFLFPFQLFAQDDPPGTVARIGYLKGDVSLQAAGTDNWSEAPPNYPMIGGDRLYTAQGSSARVELGGAELRLWQNSDVTLTNLTDQFQQVGIAQGSLRLRVFQIDQGSQIELDTPNGAVIIQSPGDYRVDADSQDQNTLVTVNSGQAQLTAPNVNLTLNSGYSMQMYGTNPVSLQYVDVPTYDELDYWSIDIDRRLQSSVSARYVSRQMVGYSDLDDNGTWSPDSEYGPVWYPRNVPQGWRPYSAGHWAYVAPWGYTWIDDAPWGFAPFHYGRWSVIGGRWGWVPGPPAIRPVYSPALVAFVGGGPGLSINIGIGGGGGGISAWFPIGVGEPYVPWYRCTPTYARQVNVTNVNITNIHNTTIVNNYNTYITNTRTVNNVNNIQVTNINYANRAQVTAVPASAMTSGAAVSKQVVRLNAQQQQQLVRAPISVKPTAPVPVKPNPSLVTKTNVVRPIARPVLMTPTGQAKAVPSLAKPVPVNVAKLPPAKVVPKNAAPPPAIAQQPRPATPATGTPATIQPQQPVAGRPAQPQPAPVIRPVTPPQPAAGIKPAQPAPVTRPVTPVQQQPVTRPAPPAQPQQPVTRPVPPVQTAPVQRPVTPPQPTRPVQQTQPAPVTRPVTPAQPAPVAKPAPVVEPARPVEQTRPAPAVRPVPPAQPARQIEQPRPAPTSRPAPTPAARPEAQPVPPPAARPAVKPQPKPAEKEKPKPKQEKPE